MTDLDSEPRPSRRLWILAGLAALVLHIGGGALALAHLQNGEPEEPLGAPAIEIGLELSAPRAEVTDLPPGPEQDTSVASPAIAEQKAEVEPTELPKDQPTQTETADRQVAPNEANKPKEDDAKPAVVATAASQESIAAEASATPSSEDSPIGRSQAPVEGVGKALQRVKASWIAKLSAHFDRHRRNPELQKYKDAKVVVDVTFDRLGHIVSSGIAQSSGDAAYDKAALDMLRRSDPVPQPPPLVADEGLHFTLPVIFQVSKGRS